MVNKNRLYLARKFVRLFVLGQHLFREAGNFPELTVSFEERIMSKYIRLPWNAGMVLQKRCGQGQMQILCWVKAGFHRNRSEIWSKKCQFPQFTNSSTFYLFFNLIYPLSLSQNAKKFQQNRKTLAIVSNRGIWPCFKTWTRCWQKVYVKRCQNSQQVKPALNYGCKLRVEKVKRCCCTYIFCCNVQSKECYGKVFWNNL